MGRSPHVTVRVDLGRVRANAEAVRLKTGVPLIPVVKADAYGLGATRVGRALADIAEAFYVFDAAEAVDYGLPAATGKRSIALLGAWNDPADYLSRRIHPVVWTADRAAALRKARPVLSVDTGQQRFGCPAESTALAAVIAAGDCREAMTHATTHDQVRAFRLALEHNGGAGGFFKHAAGTARLEDDGAWLDAVRPGLALYRGAARVSARLVEVRDATGPAGYTGFVAARHGVVLCGYGHGLRPGPCVVNGRRSRVREVGMQSAFVECGPGDKVGDEVVLLGDGLGEDEAAGPWGATPHNVLTALAGAGERTWVGT